MGLKKVYCKNCKYYHSYNLLRPIYGYSPIHNWCSAELIYEDRYNKKIKIYPIEPEEQNKANDCSLYRKKWYKFWV